MSKNYNEIVSQLREIARDGLRLGMVARVRSEIYDVTKYIDNTDKSLEKLKKAIVVAEFEKSQIVDADPRKEEKTKRFDDEIKSTNEYIEREVKNKESMEKQIANLNAEIVKITAGEVKVCRESLDSETEKLIKEVVKNTAQTLVIEEAKA